MQEEIFIGDVNIPIIKENDIIYYPISYIMEKILFKKTGVAGLQKEYSQYIKKHKVDYGINTGGIQNVNCISEEGLRKVLGNSKVGRLNIDQKRAMNILLEYLHMDVISEDDRFIKRVSEEVIEGYNEYLKDCIDYVLKEQPDIIWQKCTKCGNYYPYHENFFRKNDHAGKEYLLNTLCKNCNGWNEQRSKDLITHPDSDLSRVYRMYDLEVYKLYKNHDTIAIYEHWIKNKNKTIPYLINNEEDKMTIIRDYYNKGMFNSLDIIADNILKVCKFRVDGNKFIQRIQKELLGVVLKNGVEYVDTIEDARRIFFNYLIEKKIIIDDVYNYPYYQLITNAHLYGFLKRYKNNNLLSLIMDLYDNKYPAYKFKIRGEKYWDVKDNRIRALKYLIEDDMKIPIEKVPLYVTLTALRKEGHETMYNVCKKYYHKLFDWIDEVYPGEFNERDFDIHYIRNNFDSIDEAKIHDILTDSFKNVLYNPRNTDRTIVIDGMIPDWFVFTLSKCWIVEYFGLGVDRKVDNSRVNEYQDKMKNKIEKYKNLDGYGKIFLYPDDLKDGFKGVKEKLKEII